ncbi:hypothetical protein [Alteribacter populi]|uniref:hypothetical protein n=1 Tax=Alteribacter populi TaxID=2011011 RepID=UPI000BBB6167|nr:hypothetical protein [Alteribacter populi]
MKKRLLLLPCLLLFVFAAGCVEQEDADQPGTTDSTEPAIENNENSTEEQDQDEKENIEGEATETEENTQDSNNQEKTAEDLEKSKNKNGTEQDFDLPAEEVAFNYYTLLQNEEFEEAIHLVSPDYLYYLGITERDFINIFRDRQTLQNWSIEELDIRSVDELTIDVSIPQALEPMVTSRENYLVIVDLKINTHDEVTGGVDDVLVSTDENGDWKIFGIFSY